MSKSYKFKTAMVDCFNEIDILIDREKWARANLREDALLNEMASIQEKYSAKRADVMSAIEGVLSDLRAAASRETLNNLSVGDAEADFKLLSLPVTLGESELYALAEKNKNNRLFLRAVGEYADRQGYNDKGLHALRYTPVADKNDYAEAVQASAALMGKVTPPDNYAAAASDYNRMHTAFFALDKDGLWDKMDV